MNALFEIHLTTKPLSEEELEGFVAFCHRIDAKPILIELPAGQQRQQPMISKVVSLADPEDIHPVLTKLRADFVANGYPVTREKVEVPLEFEAAGKAAFPSYRGGYYEWHGKVDVEDSEDLEEVLKWPQAHLSRNALKGSGNQRLITFRTTLSAHNFKNWFEQITRKLDARGYPLLKSEAEYCCYDSNKAVDRGWSDIPEITDRNYLNLLGYEGFLRRAVKVDGAFMLKGSMVSRQFLDDPTIRIPGDLDFVYLEEVSPPDAAAGLFSAWVREITEVFVDDGLKFRSFRENDFWRRIDYAMDDDFPTTNTDLLFYLPDGSEHEISLDISWNLPIPQPPAPLVYSPTTPGEDFYLEQTVPLSLQVAWKLHQTIVRFRTKDIVDLIFLLDHPDFTSACRETTLEALREECEKDGIPPEKLLPFIDGSILAKLSSRFTNLNDEEIIFWELRDGSSEGLLSLHHLQWSFPGLTKRWEDVPALLRTFAEALNHAGITAERIVGM